MTTDKTPATLATVKHGGCVQLGDGLLPCPFCGNGAEFVPYKNNGLTLKCKSMGCIQRHQRTLRYGIEWLRTSMTEHWNARALSAQPSPGGQGDADTVALEIARQFMPIDAAGEWNEGQKRAALQAAIARAISAARQPVGELAGYATFRDGRFGSWLFQTRAMAESHDSTAVAGGPANSEIVPLFRSPAQAVDLGQFRPAVCAMGLYAEEPEDVDEAKRLLALIDGKAVGK